MMCDNVIFRQEQNDWTRGLVETGPVFTNHKEKPAVEQVAKERLEILRYGKLRSVSRVTLDASHVASLRRSVCAASPWRQ